MLLRWLSPPWRKWKGSHPEWDTDDAHLLSRIEAKHPTLNVERLMFYPSVIDRTFGALRFRLAVLRITCVGSPRACQLTAHRKTPSMPSPFRFRQQPDARTSVFNF